MSDSYTLQINSLLEDSFTEASPRQGCLSGGTFRLRQSRRVFALQLGRAAGEKNLSGSALAKLVGRNQGTISRWMSGEMQPSYEDLDALSKVLGKPVAYFFEDPTDPRSKSRLSLSEALHIVTLAVQDLISPPPSPPAESKKRPKETR